MEVGFFYVHFPFCFFLFFCPSFNLSFSLSCNYLLISVRVSSCKEEQSTVQETSKNIGYAPDSGTREE